VTRACVRLNAVQGTYYLATGAWSLLHRRSFEAVTGPKRDWWLVQAVALLTIVNGAVLRSAPSQAGRQAGWLALGTAAAFGTIDVAYGLPGRIRRVYLLDALVQAAFAIAAVRAVRAASPRGESSLAG
jgi:hypothetical protein